MFKKIDEADAIIVERGVFKPAEVYEGLDGLLYLKTKGGFVRVYDNMGTSHATVKLHVLHTDQALFLAPHGRVSVTSKGRDGKAHRPLGLLDGGERLLLTDKSK